MSGFITLNAIREDKPGPKWQSLFETHWPSYRAWFLAEGHLARPGYMTSLKQLRRFMPELVPIYEQLVDLAGGDLAARFLSMYQPPPYLSGCSQAVWSRANPLLVRNYDYNPTLFEGNLLYTAWRRPVIAMIDCLWGVLDGINNAGLAVSLSFGGRRLIGNGFGMPLILRYILETCDDTTDAATVLRTVPSHMPYNITVLDRQGAFLTAYLSPDQATMISDAPAATNHQVQIDWKDYARLTSTVERKEFIEACLADPDETADKFVRRFLRPPLHNTQYEKAFGTLYTAVYDPGRLQAEYHWPHRVALRQSFDDFSERSSVINLAFNRPSDMTRPHS